MPKTKVEVYDKDQLIYPFIESDHVTFSNGMKVSEMLDQSISMPTVTHEDLSFKVGVGDQDMSSAIVDSSVAEMTIKGKTYQNILPEPSTHVLTNNKEMFKVNEGLDPNVEIVDGVSKSAILSGQTLVNIVNNDNWVQGTGNNRDLFTQNISIKKGQTYTVIGKIERSDVINESEDPADVPAFRIRTGTNNSGTSLLFIQQSEAVIKQTFTNNENNTIHIRFFNQRTNYKKLMIIEGDHTQEDIPYFEGMQSVKMPVLTTTGKNLFNINAYTSLKNNATIEGEWLILGENYQANSTSTWNVTLAPNTSYYVSDFIDSDITTNNSIGRFRVVDKMGNEILKLGGFNRLLTTTNEYDYIFEIGRSSSFIGSITKFKIQIEQSSTATSYEPYKSNILSTPSDLELRGIGEVRDTLDCLTGEVVERIGEIELVNREWIKNESFLNPVYGTTIDNLFFDKDGNSMCDKLSRIPYDNRFNIEVGQYYTTADRIYVGHNNMSVSEFKSYIDRLSPKLQYQLKTPVVKTVDLSSSGNWEKVVLDGSETGWSNSYSEWANKVFCLNNSYLPNVIKPTNIYDTYVMCDKLRGCAIQWLCGELGRTGVALHSWGSGYLQIAINGVNTVDELKQYLSQNPITVWYQTATTLDSTQVKQPIFFKDGHIFQSSGADNSLIPTLDYQAKTSNSYVMDLMKTNTKYTMKAKTASGTFTIDGASYGAGTNGTFTTPSSMTNKLLVMSNKTNEEVMILEGDVVSKTIPYFKGIKSAFEGEDKIEVLSTGKNLFDGAFEKGMIDVNGVPGYVPTAIRTVNYINVKPNTSYHINLLNLEPFESFRVIYVHEYDENFKVLGETEVGNRNIYTSKSATRFIKINTHTAHDLPVDSKMIVCENSTLDKQYEPYKSNSTKIPLLSPLRSLPNGVYDELIIDRMKKKATLVKRLDCITFDGSSDENWHTWGSANSPSHLNNYHYVDGTNNTKNLKVKVDPSWIVSRLGYGGGYKSEKTGARLNSDYFAFSIPKNSIGAGSGDTDSMYEKSGRTWLSQNPITVYYELATPVITEVDLEGFPYIYKNGHIFLNSEIVPTTEIIYSVNQCQQISASNEDIIRHEKELTYLQKLIAQYVQVDYESVLLSLKV